MLSKPGYLLYTWESNFKQSKRYYVCNPFVQQLDIKTTFIDVQTGFCNLDLRINKNGKCQIDTIPLSQIVGYKKV